MMLDRRRARPTLRLSRLEDRLVPAIVFEAEPNDSIAAANIAAIAPGDILTTQPSDWTVIQGGVPTGADRDYFRFTLTTPAGVFFDVDSRDTGLSTTLDAVLDVFDSTGFSLLGQNDDGYDLEGFTAPITPAASATSPDPSLYLQLSAGTYVVRMTSFASSVGTYQLRMLADPNIATTTTPVYASLPGAPVTISLDFDGQVGSDEWGSYNLASFDLDGDIASFNPLERLAIRNVCRTVGEDFTPFAVNVTTTPAGSLADGVGYRVIFTSDDGSAVGLSASVRGAAHFGSFASAGANTGFVFQPMFGDFVGGSSGDAMAASLEEGNAASQQIGTALGLKRYGGGTPQPSAIMQFPDQGLNRATWSMGSTYVGDPPVIVQDDVAAITSVANGITLRPDDHGDTIATATPMAADSAIGIITDRFNDRDFFTLPADTSGIFNGWAHVNVYVGNFNAQIRVYNSAGTLMATGSTANTFESAVDAYLAPGQDYFLEVRSSGGAGAIGSYSVNFGANPVPGPVQVLTTSVNAGAVQRSMVTEITVSFNQPVTFPTGAASAFQVTSTSNLTVPINLDFTNSTPAHTIALIRFPDGSGGFKSIGDGAYTLTVLSLQVLDTSGNHLDGDANGIGDDNFVMPFHRLYGDTNGDRTVSQLDFTVFRNSFLSSVGSTNFVPELDSNGDNTITQSDFNLFRQNYLVTV